VITSWNFFPEISFKVKKMTWVNSSQLRQLVTWPTTESSVTNATRTSAPNVKLSHTTLERIAIKHMPGLADIVKSNWNSHLLPWNQPLEMSAENPIVSTWCKNLAIRCSHVVILATVLPQKPSVFHVWSQNASRRWTRPLLQKKIKMISVISAGAHLLVKLLV